MPSSQLFWIDFKPDMTVLNYSTSRSKVFKRDAWKKNKSLEN